MKRVLLSAILAIISAICISAATVAESDRVVVAYVTSWSRVMPDPFCMTHINYAFGHVNDTFDGVRVDNPERLHQMVALKKTNPDLKVMLSVGGWGSGRFSEMAMEGKRRKSFAEDCIRVVEEFGLDGIDIDWEYPTSSAADISSSPKDTDNFTKLMKDLRNRFAENRHLMGGIGSPVFDPLRNSFAFFVCRPVGAVLFVAGITGRGSKAVHQSKR